MTVELAPTRTGLIGTPLVNGLALPTDLTFEEWAGALRHADMIVESSPWWLVDLMIYGQRHFGEEHSQALPTAEEDPNGASQSRIKQANWLASVYPSVSTRVPGLTYTHHRIAADLEPVERAAVLRRAATARDEKSGEPKPWSTRELLLHVKAIQEQAKAIDAASTPVCAADDTTWRPTPDDLTDDASARMRFERTMAGRGASFEQGWTLALAWAEQLDCFTRD
jgi:hypothetical protein